MIKSILNYIARIKMLSKVESISGFVNISHKTNCISAKSARIILKNGLFQMGYDLNKNTPYPSYGWSLLKLGENATLIINGNVYIAPGCSLIICRGATVILEGENYIAHNTIIYCNQKIEIGKYSSTSWNCTLMDWDGHRFERVGHENILKDEYIHPLLIGNRVGIQMNVTIPRGVTIGDNSIIAANTVVRKNLPENSLIYGETDLNIKQGYKSGL